MRTDELFFKQIMTTILESYDIDLPLFEFISKHADARDEALFHMAIYDYRDEAIDEARAIAINQRSGLIFQRKVDSIRGRKSYK